MDYVFGTARYKGKLYENLKTVGDDHTDLAEFVEIKREYDDCDITDHFYIVTKVNSDTDSEGRCYDWYIIDQHYRHIDYTKLPKVDIEELKVSAATLNEQVAQADETAIELYEMQLVQDEINAAQDDALIEIYEMIGG